MYAANPLDDTESKQEGADHFMRQSIVGAIATIVVVASSLFGPLSLSPGPLRAAVGVSFLALIYALITMHRTRKADEYVERMWNVGTSAAFVAVLAFTLAEILLVMGILATGRDPLRIGWLDFDNMYTLDAALIAFFAAVLIKRFRGV